MSSTSLLKESFSDQAKTSGVILDSSNSFIPHIQTVSRSCKLHFESVSSVWLLLKTSAGPTLVHTTIIPHGVNCNSPLTPLLASALSLLPQAIARAVLFSFCPIFYLVVVFFLLIISSFLGSCVIYTLQIIFSEAMASFVALLYSEPSDSSPILQKYKPTSWATRQYMITFSFSF